MRSHDVARVRDDLKVFARIVERVSVDMIDVVSGGSCKDEAMEIYETTITACAFLEARSNVSATPV